MHYLMDFQQEATRLCLHAHTQPLIASVRAINHVKQDAGCCWWYSLRTLHMIRKSIMWRISICRLHVGFLNPWGMCVYLPVKQTSRYPFHAACISLICAILHVCVRLCMCIFVCVKATSHFFVNIPLCTHAYLGPWSIWVCKFNVSAFAMG